MGVLIGGALAGIAALSIARSVEAHHAFASEFDAAAPVHLEGSVVRVEWVNPHAWIHITVQEGGEEVVWMIEGGTPNSLARRGLRRDCLPIGTQLVVDGYRARDPNLRRANARNVTFTDGRRFFVGSIGTGAPYDADASTTDDQAC
jgi:hypothetical protein